LEAGSVSPDVVAIEARKHAANQFGTAAGERTDVELSQQHYRPQRSRSRVVSLPERRRVTEPPPDSRTAPPSVQAYDQLLTSKSKKGNVS
jgi:hypothetical protein